MSMNAIVNVAAGTLGPFSCTWWIEQFVSWLVFSALVTCALHQLRVRREKKERKPFENWELILLGEDDLGDHQPLYWEEVRRIKDSEFERWKLVKSVMSGRCKLEVTRIAKAKEWAFFDKDKKQVIIDFNKIPPEHMKGGCWSKKPPRLSPDAKCSKVCPPGGSA